MIPYVYYLCVCVCVSCAKDLKISVHENKKIDQNSKVAFTDLLIVFTVCIIVSSETCQVNDLKNDYNIVTGDCSRTE